MPALDRQGLAAYTEFFRGDYLGAGDVSTRMAEWWDLVALTGLYDEFCATYRPLLDVPVSDPEKILRGLTCRCSRPGWRLPYLDPGLPLEHLPADWSGIEAGALFTAA